LSRDRDVQREILPIPDRPYAGQITYDAKDPYTSFPPIEPLRPPAGAPNVLVILLDDVGFGAASSADETCDVGSESGTPVTGDYGASGNEFSGRVDWVQIDLGEDAEDADHLISPQERLRVAMARQ
jgi:hypothetical protein